ncbi:MAG: FCD domain-containing protein [Lacisediminihabitans sp.]
MSERNDSTREWKRVLDALEVRLLEGNVNTGDRLPSERTIASRLKVRRESVREALRVLEILSLVSTRPGTRMGSAGILVATPSGGMGALMRLQVAAQGFRVSDVVGTRLLLESAVVMDLADRIDIVDFASLTELLVLMDEPKHSPPEYIALNAKFHMALAEASGNKIVTAVMAGLRHSIEAATHAGADAASDWPATVARLQKEHRDLLDFIAAGDGPSAAALIKRHISSYYDETHVLSSEP